MILQRKTRSLEPSEENRPVRTFSLPIPPLIAVALLLAFVLLALGLLAPILAPYSIREQSLLNRLKPPVFISGESSYLLGTDHLGRDLLSRLLFGLRTTLGIATAGTLLGLLVGAGLGLLAGVTGGFIDTLIMFLVDIQVALPSTLVALTAVAIFGTSLQALILILGIAGWDAYARIVRGQVLATRDLAFVEAARALGVNGWQLTLRHILPNIVSPIIVLATMNFSFIVLLESGLSFLGLGVQPPHTSLGLMLGAGRDYMASAWWIAAWPASLIILISIVISLLGDWLRDVLDPNLSA
ncbi:MAG: ABC transporter permease [Trueperaceae bacterium]|nr:ABC transporter permease [Trueperaceae bacterium]